MNIREQFEDWYVREYPWGRDALSIAEFTGDDECGRYTDMSFAGVLSASWKAWQAASKASEQQLAAVVAENAQMLRLLTDISENHDEYVNADEYMYAGIPLDYVSEINMYVSRDVNADNPFKATDAYLAEVRAQGVEMFANSMAQHLAVLKGNGDSAMTQIQVGTAERLALAFAAQLRQGAEK